MCAFDVYADDRTYVFYNVFYSSMDFPTEKILFTTYVFAVLSAEGLACGFWYMLVLSVFVLSCCVFFILVCAFMYFLLVGLQLSFSVAGSVSLQQHMCYLGLDGVQLCWGCCVFFFIIWGFVCVWYLWRTGWFYGSFLKAVV